MQIRFNKSERAPYKRDQVLFRAKIISTAPAGGRFKQDVIDLNHNGKADCLNFHSADCRRREVLEPTIHSGTDASCRPVGMSRLRDLARESGQRYFGEEQLGNWSTYRETISFGEKGQYGSAMHDWHSLTDVAKSICPEFNYTKGPSVAIDLKRCEFVIYDPNKGV